MRMMVSILAISAIGLSACKGSPPEKTEILTNGSEANLLGEVDGCRIWQLNRGGMTRTVYFARCAETATTQTYFKCGKNCKDMDVVVTPIMGRKP